MQRLPNLHWSRQAWVASSVSFGLFQHYPRQGETFPFTPGNVPAVLMDLFGSVPSRMMAQIQAAWNWHRLSGNDTSPDLGLSSHSPPAYPQSCLLPSLLPPWNYLMTTSSQASSPHLSETPVLTKVINQVTSTSQCSWQCGEANVHPCVSLSPSWVAQSELCLIIVVISLQSSTSTYKDVEQTTQNSIFVHLHE